MLWGEGSGAIEKGTFGSGWGRHKSGFIRHMYKSLCRKLSDKNNQFAPFDILSFLIGDSNARIFCRDRLRHYYRPAPPVDDVDVMEIDD
jgi:hypothetical protein